MALTSFWVKPFFTWASQSSKTGFNFSKTHLPCLVKYIMLTRLSSNDGTRTTRFFFYVVFTNRANEPLFLSVIKAKSF